MFWKGLVLQITALTLLSIHVCTPPQPSRKRIVQNMSHEIDRRRSVSALWDWGYSWKLQALQLLHSVHTGATNHRNNKRNWSNIWTGTTQAIFRMRQRWVRECQRTLRWISREDLDRSRFGYAEWHFWVTASTIGKWSPLLHRVGTGSNLCDCFH